jgi:hypothetical protein
MEGWVGKDEGEGEEGRIREAGAVRAGEEWESAG